jgi:hypothetical protein
LIKWLLTLFVQILLHHVWFDRSSSSFSMLCPPLLGIDCLSFPLLVIQARPHPLPPTWHRFPQTPGNSRFHGRHTMISWRRVVVLYLCSLT